MGNIYPNEECEILTKIKEVLAGASMSGEIVNPPDRNYPNEECKILDKIKYIFAYADFVLLPDDYKQVIGFTYNNNCYFPITDFKMRGSDTLRFAFKCTQSTPACNILGAYDGGSSGTNYSLYVGASASAKYLRYNGSTYNSQAITDKTYNVIITPTGSTGMENDSTWTEATFESTGDLCIGTTSPTATSSKMIGDIVGNIEVDGRLKLIPCERVSDSVLGYYDTVSKNFYTPVGTPPVSMGYA